jgi:phosphate transport system protein
MNSTHTGDPAEGHTNRKFDHTLAELRLSAVEMGGLVMEQVSAALRALVEGNTQLANLVLQREAEVNELERKIDRDVYQAIALRQPVAGDLRIARAVSRIAIDLERAGDEAKKIARFALRLQPNDPHGPLRAVSLYLKHMSELSVGMLRNALRALDESDDAMAAKVRDQDIELDAEFETALRQLLTLVMEGEPYLRVTIDTVFALKGLERIGDHAKNIAENVDFMLRGA